jgi:hypothetical protein
VNKTLDIKIVNWNGISLISCRNTFLLSMKLAEEIYQINDGSIFILSHDIILDIKKPFNYT